MAKRVIAYEDEDLLRKQLEYIFFSIRDEYLLVESFSNTSGITDQLATIRPDIVIMDIQMTHDDEGLEGLYRIKTMHPDIKVLMLTSFDIDEKVMNAICLGADGYMLKSDFASHQLPHETIRKSMRIIFDGGAYLTPSVAKRIMNLLANPTLAQQVVKIKEKFRHIFNGNSKKNSDSGLTRMQLLVLQKIADGQSTAEIARELDLSVNTINTHIKGIYNILEVHSRSKAIKKALGEKWVH